MTKQHLKLLVSLSVPTMIVITKTDLTDDKPDIYHNTCNCIKDMIATICGKNSKCLFVNDPFNKDDDDITHSINNVISLLKCRKSIYISYHINFQ